VSQGQVEGSLATHRRSDDDGLLNAGRVHDGYLRRPRRPPVLVLVRGGAEAACVVRNAPVARGQSLNDALPTTSIADSGVDEQVSVVVDTGDLVGQLSTS
jgi:hypothetical protein